MDEVSFTAGITFSDDRVMTVDVTAIDAGGIAYTSEDGAEIASWADVKAVMLATTDHMLESAGALFSMAETIRQTDTGRTDEAVEMRRFGLQLLLQAAPRLCPLADGCGLRPAAPPAKPPSEPGAT